MLQNLFTPVVQGWQNLLRRANEEKERRFAPEAREGLMFFAGDLREFWNSISNTTSNFFQVGAANTIRDTDVRMTVNKTAELVEIFGPVLYQNNPTRRATIPEPPPIDPQIFTQFGQQYMMRAQMAYQQAGQQYMVDKAIASMFEAMENITPQQLNLKMESRAAIDESIITGLSWLFHDYVTNPGTGARTCGSFWVSQKDVLIDPEVKHISRRKWMARRTMMPKWEAERKFRLYPNTLSYVTTGTSQSFDAARTIIGDPRERDLVEVWEIYSKMGAGRFADCSNLPMEQRAGYEMLGDYCYLAIVPGFPWPLNLPPSMFASGGGWQQAQKAVEWPCPHWIEGEWPATPIYFHTQPGDVWPVSHLSPGMGELKFLNWAYSMMGIKIKTTCRDMMAVDSEIVEELKMQLAAGGDLGLVSVPGLGEKDLSKIIQQIQHQQWNPDIWKVISAVSEQFDLRVGLTDLMYGLSSKQMRSAAEADKKYEAVNVRPDDMSDKVVQAMGDAAEREKLCLYWHMRGEDVENMLGPVGRLTWESFVEPADPRRILGIHMRIESDSMKRPNTEALAQSLQEAFQMLAQPLFQLATMGIIEPWNTLLLSWAEAMKIPDRERLAIRQPMPLPPAGEQGGPPLPEKQAA